MKNFMILFSNIHILLFYCRKFYCHLLQHRSTLNIFIEHKVFIKSPWRQKFRVRTITHTHTHVGQEIAVKNRSNILSPYSFLSGFQHFAPSKIWCLSGCVNFNLKRAATYNGWNQLECCVRWIVEFFRKFERFHKIRL